MSISAEVTKARPPLLRGGLTVVFLWIVVQMPLAGLALANRLFGVLTGPGYVDTILEFGWAGVDWSLWPVILAEFAQPILLIALHIWLLIRFFRRSQTFTFEFISVLALIALLNLMLATLYQAMLGEISGIGPTASVFALGAYQYLCSSPRAKAVFGGGPSSTDSPITDA